MAGLGRVQQRFNAAVVAVLALLKVGAGGSQKERDRAQLMGQPIARKFLRTQDYAKATGRDLPDYPGYCSGERERAKRVSKRYATLAERHGL